ncbi:MAG: RNA pseudouridine synthase [Proteobacteria bacterium]|nr:RNA pseudouridine synthase [Pseudomonadota bacterium]MBU1688581.1 RNA pseudouridine synthase [Pseudomonadota bacterium]
MNPERKSIELHLPVTRKSRAVDLLAEASNLPRARLKDAMIKGAVRLNPGRGRTRRLRRATTEVWPGDTLHLYYDEKILTAPVPVPTCIRDERSFSIWFKPIGLLAQGTDFGDFCSLLRQVELHFEQKRKVYPVHRLDREVSGLVLVAHDPKTAGKLGRRFAERQVAKTYLAGIQGRIAKDEELLLDGDLDGKPAVTRCLGLRYDLERNESLVLASPETGRLHQIRRHLAGHGTPILGDPRYGESSKGPMRLCAVRLVFAPDQNGGVLDLILPEQYQPEWATTMQLPLDDGFPVLVGVD